MIKIKENIFPKETVKYPDTGNEITFVYLDQGHSLIWKHWDHKFHNSALPGDWYMFIAREIRR